VAGAFAFWARGGILNSNNEPFYHERSVFRNSPSSHQ